jgi:hypothetical protein
MKAEYVGEKMNRKSRFLSRHASGGIVGNNGRNETPVTPQYPPYLHNEYINDYCCGPQKFIDIVKSEVEECRIKKSDKNESYKLWFGKYKDHLLHSITDMDYLYYLRDVYRKTNKKLVGQVLIRIEEYNDHLWEEYKKTQYGPVTRRERRKLK